MFPTPSLRLQHRLGAFLSLFLFFCLSSLISLFVLRSYDAHSLHKVNFLYSTLWQMKKSNVFRGLYFLGGGKYHGSCPVNYPWNLFVCQQKKQLKSFKMTPLITHEGFLILELCSAILLCIQPHMNDTSSGFWGGKSSVWDLTRWLVLIIFRTDSLCGVYVWWIGQRGSLSFGGQSDSEAWEKSCSQSGARDFCHWRTAKADSWSISHAQHGFKCTVLADKTAFKPLQPRYLSSTTVPVL